MTAETRIHVALLLALAAANLAILVRGPFEGPLPPAQAARSALSQPLAEASRAEIDAAVERVQSWLASSRSSVAAGSASAVALSGLGPAPEERSQPERWLARLLGSDATMAWLVPASDLTTRPPQERRTLTTALVILLESGIPLEQQLPAGPAEKAPGLKLSELIQRVLDAEPAPPDGHADEDPERLDLLSLAVLGGLGQYRERLARATEGTLRRLDRAQRIQQPLVGTGVLQQPQLAELARAWRGEPGQPPAPAGDLRASSALFRATAVLQEPDLVARARRQLGTLLFRYRNERALYLYLEASARSERERRQTRVQALEQLGRLEEALYNAHLSFRSAAGAAPPPDTARVMRVAARDLIERLDTLEAASPGDTPEQTGELLRAAVRALRGLRTARLGAS